MCLACCHVLQGLITVKVDEMLLFFYIHLLIFVCFHLCLRLLLLLVSR